MPKNFNRHDNIDYEVVEVSKHKLLYMFNDCAKYASTPTETVTYASIALTLFATVFFTETSRGIFTISGETIQAAFLVGGIVASVVAIYKGIQWYKVKDKFTPESMIEGLIPSVKNTPQVLLPAPEKEVLKQPSTKLRKVVSTKNKQVMSLR